MTPRSRQFFQMPLIGVWKSSKNLLLLGVLKTLPGTSHVCIPKRMLSMLFVYEDMYEQHRNFGLGFAVTENVVTFFVEPAEIVSWSRARELSTTMWTGNNGAASSSSCVRRKSQPANCMWTPSFPCGRDILRRTRI